MLLEFFFIGEGCRIDTLQHGVLLITTPVSASNAGQFKDLKHACCGDMRSTTQVNKGALTIKGDFLHVEVFNQLNLVVLAKLTEQGDRLGAFNNLAFDRQVGLGQLLHLLLNRVKFFGAEGMFISEKIVIEARLNRRAYGHLNVPTVKLFNCMGHQVGGRMTIELKALGGIEGHQAQINVAIDRSRGIDQGLTKKGSHCLAGKTFTNRTSHVKRRCSGSDFLNSSVWQCYVQHRHPDFLLVTLH